MIFLVRLEAYEYRRSYVILLFGETGECCCGVSFSEQAEKQAYAATTTLRSCVLTHPSPWSNSLLLNSCILNCQSESKADDFCS